MSLVKRLVKGSKLTIEEMDGNLQYLENLTKANNPISKLGNFSKGLLIDNLNTGFFLKYEEGLELPDSKIYIISSVESHLRIVQALIPDGDTRIFLNRLLKFEESEKKLVSSIETYLKLEEAYSTYSMNKNLSLDIEFLNRLESINQFSSKKTRSSIEYLDSVIDKGIVEIGTISGKSQIQELVKISIGDNKPSGKNLPIGSEFFVQLLDTGLVVIDVEKISAFSQMENYITTDAKGVLIMSIDAFLAFSEYTDGPSPA